MRNPTHGKWSTYVGGCRCDICRAAATAYMRARRIAASLANGPQRAKPTVKPEDVVYPIARCFCESCHGRMAVSDQIMAGCFGFRPERWRRKGAIPSPSLGLPVAAGSFGVGRLRGWGNEFRDLTKAGGFLDVFRLELET